jgi:hypothetical protein
MLAMLSGCAAMRENRPLCIAVFTGTGAALGGTAGGLIASEVVNHGDSGGSRNWEVAGGTGAGVVAGGLIGWALSNAFCEEPPPPPPPAPVRTPPPPPPPPTERRGG